MNISFPHYCNKQENTVGAQFKAKSVVKVVLVQYGAL